MILLDTSGVLAWIDAAQKQHGEVVEAMQSQSGPFLLSPFVLAELDCLLATRVGPHAQRRLLDEVVSGAFTLEPFTANDVQQALEVMKRYSDLNVGLADASIAILSVRHRCDTLLTLDERHFRVLAGYRQRPFHILPADYALDFS